MARFGRSFAVPRRPKRNRGWPFWYARDGGSPNNGGGFDPSLGGTNFADQDSPQHSYASGTLVGYVLSPTALFSSSTSFGAAAAGNYIYLSGGANVIVGWYKIVISAPFMGDTFTLDRAWLTADTTTATGN